jgi:hypothetical protein
MPPKKKKKKNRKNKNSREKAAEPRVEIRGEQSTVKEIEEIEEDKDDYVIVDEFEGEKWKKVRKPKEKLGDGEPWTIVPKEEVLPKSEAPDKDRVNVGEEGYPNPKNQTE